MRQHRRHQPGNVLDATATLSENGKNLTLQVVNTGKAPLSTRLELAGYVPRNATAHVTVLTGDWDVTNTPEQPNRIKPSESDWPHGYRDGATRYAFPPHSFTVLSFR